MRQVYLLARVRGERYAFAVDAVREVGRSFDATPVPGAPSSVLGVHNLRGEVLPVVDLAAVLGLSRGESQAVVVAEDAGRRAALTIDELIDVQELAGGLRAADAPLAGSMVADGELVGVVDVAAVLDAAQRER